MNIMNSIYSVCINWTYMRNLTVEIFFYTIVDHWFNDWIHHVSLTTWCSKTKSSLPITAAISFVKHFYPPYLSYHMKKRDL